MEKDQRLYDTLSFVLSQQPAKAEQAFKSYFNDKLVSRIEQYGKEERLDYATK